MRWRVVFKQMFPSEDDANITESNAETAIKYLTAQRGQDTSVGNATAGITMRQKELEQRAELEAKREGRLWASMSQEEKLARLRIEEAREARETAAAAKKEEQVAGATERLGGELDKTGAPKFFEQYGEAQALLKKYPKDLPGLGRLDGRVPDEALSPDGRQLRFLVGQLLSEYRKGQTGAGMSDAERAEYGQITGLIYSGSDAAVKQGLDTLKRAMDARVAAIKGGFRPEAVSTYENRVPSIKPKTPTTKRPPPAAPAQVAPSAPARRPVSETMSKDGTKKRVTYSDGSVEVVDAKP
jgi:hypothetical protein